MEFLGLDSFVTIRFGEPLLFLMLYPPNFLQARELSQQKLGFSLK